jgi:hypothetical protein
LSTRNVVEQHHTHTPHNPHPLVTIPNAFPFFCEVTIDDVHKAYCSWMEIKNQKDLMYHSIVHFHKGLKTISTTTVPDDLNSGTPFHLDWYQVEAEILKTRLGLDPQEPDTLENSPFRRVFYITLTF